MIIAGGAALLSLACVVSQGYADAPIDPDLHKHFEYKSFRTEPEHHPIIWDTHTIVQDRSLLAPGYLFFAPKVTDSLGWGPKIYTVDGELVWDGTLTTAKGIAGEFRVCDWDGEKDNHLCLHDRPDLHGSNHPEDMLHNLGNRVFDNTYRQVGLNYTETGDLKGAFPDGHDFNMLPGGKTFLYPVKDYTTMDLSKYGGPKHGMVKDSCFQESDIKTGKPFFTWRSTDHLDVWETFIFPSVEGHVNLTSAIAGDGTYHNAWDFIHMNSIDKNEEGDYLVSARHLDTVVKVAGPDNRHGLEPGTIIWRLGGKKSNFKMNDVLFSRQHHVRYISTGPSGDIISLFNNGWEGFKLNPPTVEISSGVIIEANNLTMEAHVVHEYPNPESLLSGSRGSMQLLPNKNALVGWGHGIPQLTEFSENGRVLFHAHVHYPECMPTGCGRVPKMAFVYRVHKKPWVARPYWPPKLLVYSRTCNAVNPGVIAYVSWNGATEVKSWRFFTADTATGPWRDAGTFPRTGFEIKVNVPPLPSRNLPFVHVDALDENGQVLGSVNGSAFVPARHILKFCDQSGCGHHFEYDRQNNASSCQRTEVKSEEAVEKEAADKEVAEKEAAEKEAAEKEAAEKEAAEKEATEKETAEKETAEKEASDEESPSMVFIVPAVIGLVVLIAMVLQVVRILHQKFAKRRDHEAYQSVASGEDKQDTQEGYFCDPEKGREKNKGPRMSSASEEHTQALLDNADTQS